MASKSSGTSPDKRRKYDAAFKAEAVRLARENRSTQAPTRQLGTSKSRALRARLKRAEQELGI